MYTIHKQAPEGVTFNNVRGRKRQFSSQLPFDTVQVGECFFAPMSEFKPNTVRVMASRKGRTGKEFVTTTAKDGTWVKRIS